MKKVIFSFLVLFGVLVGYTNVSAKTIEENLTLEEDIAEQLVIDGTKVIIDLNGHNISGNINNIIIVQNGGDLTIKGQGTIESTNGQAIYIAEDSMVTLDSGNVKSVETGVVLFNTAKFTMNGGKIETVDNCAIGGNGGKGNGGYTITLNNGELIGNIKSNGYVSCGIYHPNEGTVIVNGGKINSTNGAGIVQRGGTLEINGGEIIAKGSTTGKVGDSRVVVPASAVVVDKYAGYPAVDTIKTTISNNVLLQGEHSDIEKIGENIIITLNGGIYNEEPSEEMIPEGYNVYQIDDSELQGKYIVLDDNEVKYNVSYNKIDEIDDSELQLIEKNLTEKDIIVGHYEISLDRSTQDGIKLAGAVNETENEIDLEIEIPELPDLAPGYTRVFKVIRVHNGETSILDATLDGTKVKTKSKLFSTYTVIYEDKKIESQDTTLPSTTTITNNTQQIEKNPKTSDGLVKYIGVFLISCFALSSSYILLKKNY